MAFMPLHFNPGIHGTIEPADAANKIWAISGRDSVATMPVSGKFTLEVKPGNWTLVVQATSPYKNTVLENIFVQENQSTDVGVIKLSK